MSLNWNATKCGEGWKALDPAVADVLIWATLAVGLGRITEKNVDEWCFRLRVLESIGTTLLVTGKGKHFNPSRADVEAAVGLTTNVFPEKKRAAWLAGIGRIVGERVEQQMRHEARMAEAQAKTEEVAPCTTS